MNLTPAQVIVFATPVYQHAAMFPPEPFDLRRTPYGPPLGRGRLVAATHAFLVAMVATLVLLMSVGWLSTPPANPAPVSQAGLRTG